MQFNPPLIKATLLKRYKRFLADVSHPELGEFTVHCPNTGSMKNCWKQGDTVYLQDSQNPKRKYLYTWTLSQNKQKDWLCLNTQLANKLVAESFEQGKLEGFEKYQEIRQEVKYGEENSRIDLMLSAPAVADCYIEIKSVTLLEPEKGAGHGYFPDAVSSRGQKHLRELIKLIEQGKRAVLFFLVQHTGIRQVRPAEHIDPEYAKLLRQAANCGVEILAYNTHIDAATIYLDEQIPVILQ